MYCCIVVLLSYLLPYSDKLSTKWQWRLARLVSSKAGQLAWCLPWLIWHWINEAGSPQTELKWKELAFCGCVIWTIQQRGLKYRVSPKDNTWPSTLSQAPFSIKSWWILMFFLRTFSLFYYSNSQFPLLHLFTYYWCSVLNWFGSFLYHSLVDLIFCYFHDILLIWDTGKHWGRSPQLSREYKNIG